MKQCKTCTHEKVCEKAKHIENYRIGDCENYKNDTEDYYCEYCSNFEKEHVGMDGMSICKITNTLAYCEENGANCPFFNKPLNKWISVDERLPENGGMYLVYNPNRAISKVITARYSSERCRWVAAEACCYHEGITHWMPLPEPPMNGERKEK